MLVLVFGGGYYLGYHSFQDQNTHVTVKKEDGLHLPGQVEKETVTAQELTSALSRISELATYAGNYSLTKTVNTSIYIFEDIRVPGSRNTIDLKCDGVVKVGYDVSAITHRIDPESGIIYIALPEARVLDNYIIWDSVEVSEKNCIFNPITFDQYDALLTGFEAAGLEQAEADGVYEKAEAHMKQLVKNTLAVFRDYRVEFM